MRIGTGPVLNCSLAMRRKEKPERDKMNGLKSMICLAVISASLHLGASSQPQLRPILMNTCLITTNVNRLVNFYEGVLGIEAERSGNQYVEFRTGVGVL